MGLEKKDEWKTDPAQIKADGEGGVGGLGGGLGGGVGLFFTGRGARRGQERLARCGTGRCKSVVRGAERAGRVALGPGADQGVR